MTKRLAWLTDIHMDFLNLEQTARFMLLVSSQDADAIVISGDIATAPLLYQSLKEFSDHVKIPVYFVLGNHDFYHGSIHMVRASVIRWTHEMTQLTWLPDAGIIELTPTTAMIGHDGWADGRLGDYENSPIELNDYYLVQELRGLGKTGRLPVLNALGDEAADYFRMVLPAALERYEHVIVVTHVPPFKSTTWHGDKLCDDDWLPHFSCHAVGDALLTIMEANPDKRITVLCGHTHSPCTVRIRSNLLVVVGKAEYREPIVQQILVVD
jgi:3',5'-cyclic AMP phosphodiesterase CpdA